MRFRKLLAVVGAATVAGVLAPIPPADATTPLAIGQVLVGGSAADTGYDLDGVLEEAGVHMQTLFGNGELGCVGGTAAGRVNGGTTGVRPAPAFTFDELSLDCDSFIPGTTVDMDLSGCDVEVTMDDHDVHAGLGDTGPGSVAGLADLTGSGGEPCVRVTTNSGCTLWIGGAVDAEFHEAATPVDGVDHQELRLVGTGLTVAGGAQAPTGCLGIVSAGAGLDLDVTFDVRVSGATFRAVDFAPDANATASHGPVAGVAVGGSDADADYDLHAVLTSGGMRMQTFQGYLDLGCSSGTIDGEVHGGGTADPAFTLDDLNLSCVSFYPSWSANVWRITGCDVDVDMNDDLVHNGLSDTGYKASHDPDFVSGVAHLSDGTGRACVEVNAPGGPCHLWVGGSVAVEFHEAVRPGGAQELRLVGSGLAVSGNPAAPSWCFGHVSTGNAITLDLTFDVTSDGPIDFRPAP
ncbi:hypothetical protein KM427_10865 [Nocardioides sp. LMS-CY]|uniref:hypothetical protein n=1 Tax=Nocardioides sp. (strain LMS-CY) TaxID=2840457 RepID=UPI001C002FE8|nr:hypothetical protein [Nocardioides sp. LMS-CY]QWF24141.1 hypothetical protein KM427_10865 [Nocardioides sp. LMS-CY]